MSEEREIPADLYTVFVVALQSEVMKTGKFAQRNPRYCAGQACYYVDVTDIPVDIRVDQLMHGIKGSGFVRMYGTGLRVEFTADLAPSRFDVTAEHEARIARSLRAEGCGVWAPVLDAPETSNVYVIRLDEAVLSNRRFRAANPGYVEGKLCVYVGATGLTPEERFANHRAGHKSNWYAHSYGEVLLPDLFDHLNPMTHQRALATEFELAEELRREGYAVWQN
jgi:hypothetical protein